MFKLAQVKKGERVVDLGSGDGRLVIEAAKKGAYAVGVELHKKANETARTNIKKYKVSRYATIREENMWKTDIADFDVIFVYGVTYIMAKLEKKLLQEAKNGARIVSNNYQFPHLKPVKEIHNVRLYRIT